MGQLSSLPGTTTTQPHAGDSLCSGDPPACSSPTIPGRASLCWLAPLHNPAAACCFRTTIGTVFILFVTGSTKVLGVEALLPGAVI